VDPSARVGRCDESEGHDVMKVKELQETLATLDPEMEVVLAGDAEGNYFYSLGMTEEVLWDEKNSEVIHPDDNEDWNEDGPVRAVVLWPG
jgi:hypothetical protein